MNFLAHLHLSPGGGLVRVGNFMADGGSIRGAMEAYVAAVKNGSFPDNALHAW